MRIVHSRLGVIILSVIGGIVLIAITLLVILGLTIPTGYEIKQNKIIYEYDDKIEKPIIVYKTLFKREIQVENDEIEIEYFNTSDKGKTKAKILFGKFEYEYEIEVKEKQLYCSNDDYYIKNGIISFINDKYCSGYRVSIADNVIEVDKDKELNLYEQKIENNSFVAVNILKRGIDGKSLDSMPISITIKKQPLVQNISFYDNVITWDAIEGVSNYSININGQEYIRDTNNFVIESKLNLPEGNNIVKIKSMANNQLSLDSYYTSIEVIKLERPGMVEFCDGEIKVYKKTGELVEDGFYKLYIDNVESDDKTLHGLTAGEHKINCSLIENNFVESNLSMTLLLTKLSTPVLSIKNNVIQGTTSKTKLYVDGEDFDGDLSNLESGTHILTGKDIASTIAELDSNLSTEYTFRKLSSVSDVELSNGILSWKTISYAGSYKITINTHEIEVTEAQWKIYKSYFNAETNLLKIECLSNIEAIVYSNVSTFNLDKLVSPVIIIQNQQIQFSNKETSMAYTVYVDGEIKVDKDISNVTVGEHKIKCIYSQDGKIDSEYSNEVTITKLSAPTLSIADNLIQGTTSKTKLYVDGEDFDGDFSKLSEGIHTLTGQEIANTSKEVNSSISTGYIFSKLANVSNVEINNGLISWKPIENVSQYKIVINTHEIEVTDSKWECIKSYFSDNNNSFSIVCLSNSEAIVNSNEAMFNIDKLPTPVIIIQNQQIQFSNKETSIAYTVYVDGEIKADKDISNVTVGEHKIKCIYSQDGKIDSEYSNEVTITKLTAPILSIADNLIQGTTSKTQLYVDDVEFDGDFSTIASGTHYLTGKNITTADNEISSDLSQKCEIIVPDDSLSISYSKKYKTLSWSNSDSSYVKKIVLKQYDSSDTLLATKEYTVSKTAYYQEYPVLKSNATKFIFEITITGDGDNVVSKTITKEFYIGE